MGIEKYIGEATEYDKKLKLEVRKPKSWLKSVSAFANGIGGTLIFGVADDGTIVGLSNAQKDSEKISEILKARMDPIPNIVMEILSENGGSCWQKQYPFGFRKAIWHFSTAQ